MLEPHYSRENKVNNMAADVPNPFVIYAAIRQQSMTRVESLLTKFCEVAPLVYID